MTENERADRPTPPANDADRMESALKAGRLGVFDYDIQRDRIGWDDRVRELWGIDAETPVDTPLFFSRLHPDDKARVASAVEKSLDPAGTRRIETHYRVINRVDGRTRWLEAEGDVTFEDSVAVRMVGIVSDVTERRMAEEEIRLRTRELDHRVRNLLALVQAVAVQSFRNADSIPEGLTSFTGRLSALAAAQSTLASGDWLAGSLKEAAVNAVRGSGADVSRFTFSGDDAVLTAKQIQALTLITHELCTNAVKYGALSAEDGHITLRSAMLDASEGPQRLQWIWQEHGGPPVAPPSRKGFGTQLIEELVRRDADGELELHYRTEGVRCELVLPVNQEDA